MHFWAKVVRGLHDLPKLPETRTDGGGLSSQIYGGLDLGLLPVHFQMHRMGFVLQHLQCKQKNLKHFSEEGNIICIVEISKSLRAQWHPQKPSVRCVLKDPIYWEKATVESCQTPQLKRNQSENSPTRCTQFTVSTLWTTLFLWTCWPILMVC